MYQGMKLDDKAFRYMYRSIELLQGTDNVRELAQLSTSYGDLSAYLAENERLDEAIALCEKRLDVISRMSLLPGPPPGYIDQQYDFCLSCLRLCKAGALVFPGGFGGFFALSVLQVVPAIRLPLLQKIGRASCRERVC